jgi:alkanesulfonate monooxygenase SsuD/methylene tetrahydromethanopterin reductase-like flavin-dependent oxidoreductase (luciferase family)
MRLGMFGQPAHPPGKSPYDCQEWDLQVIRWMDEFGYDEAWFGEHHALPWEPNPAPDILIGQAIRETKRIRLGTGGVCLPYHNPAVVANRIAWLDHIAQGRLNFGVAAGAVPADWKYLGINGADTRDMTRESLEIIRKIWSREGPFVYRGKYWTIEVEPPNLPLFDVHIRPLQRPHPPIGVSGLSPNSPTLNIAGRMGFLPMSLAANTPALRTHWDAYVAGAQAAGRTANRADWRVVKEIIVAETDAKAEKIALEGGLAEYVRGYLGPTARHASSLQGLPFNPDDYRPETMLRTTWIVGSPTTVREKLEQFQDEAGGFGTLLVFACDYAAQPEAWRDSLKLLAEEVVPKMSTPLASATA